jgi:hypothetical protein
MDNRKLLDCIQAKIEFTEKEILSDYFGLRKYVLAEEVREIKEYLSQLCSIKVLRKKWFRKEYIRLEDPDE